MIKTVDSNIATAESGRIIHVENSGTVGADVAVAVGGLTVGVAVGEDVGVGVAVSDRPWEAKKESKENKFAKGNEMLIGAISGKLSILCASMT